MQRAKSEYAIQTVTNALRLLESFGADEGIGVTELARRLHLHKNNVFRLLATLEEKGYVEQSADSERYRLGPSCLRISRSYTRAQLLTRVGRPALVVLAREAGETAHLGILRDHEVVHVDGEPGSGLLLAGLRIGARLPLHCTALGKALLGCGAPAQLQRYDEEVAARGLEALTPETIIDRDKLIEHLRRVRALGHAADLEETCPGVSCAAAPVLDAQGEVVAALSISAPASRARADLLEDRLVPLVVSHANALSRQLGAAF